MEVYKLKFSKSTRLLITLWISGCNYLSEAVDYTINLLAHVSKGKAYKGWQKSRTRLKHAKIACTTDGFLHVIVHTRVASIAKNSFDNNNPIVNNHTISDGSTIVMQPQIIAA